MARLTQSGSDYRPRSLSSALVCVDLAPQSLPLLKMDINMNKLQIELQEKQKKDKPAGLEGKQSHQRCPPSKHDRDKNPKCHEEPQKGVA
mmetsp:Transcript_27275/g.48595  ORF Transcript_27275/g.48595 Transcript_27275/m.48595 type:complete len:90 (-) Transcript_27275:220-489(-)